MVGDWQAEGRYDEASNWANAKKGDVLVRLWHFERTCDVNGCHLIFSRQAPYGPLSSELSWSGDHWLASFDHPVPSVSSSGASCPPATEHSQWTLTVSSSKIHAVENATAGSCQPATAVIDWTAKQG